MNFRSFEDLVKTVRAGMHKVPADIDAVAFIPRSGVFPGAMIALYRNIPFTDIQSLASGSFYESGQRKLRSVANERPKYLIVDDSVFSGESMKKARELLALISDECTLIYCAIYGGPGWQNKVDFIFEEVAMPRLFEWNFLHHERLEQACVDIDGVICIDPSHDQNDDDEKYHAFLRDAVPYLNPSETVGCFVSSRLEKYREHTEQYLVGRGIKYHHLVLLGGVTAEERRKHALHAKFKASVYKKMVSMNLFIESDPKQARQINRLSGKAVICTQNMVFYPDGFLRRAKQRYWKIVSWIGRTRKGIIRAV